MATGLRSKIKYLVIGGLLLALLGATIIGVVAFKVKSTLSELEADGPRLASEIDERVHSNEEIASTLGSDFEVESLQTMTRPVGMSPTGTVNVMRRAVYRVYTDDEEMFVTVVANGVGGKWVIDQFELNDVLINRSESLDEFTELANEEIIAAIHADEEILAITGPIESVEDAGGSTSIKYDELTDVLEGNLQRKYTVEGERGKVIVEYKAENDDTKWVVTERVIKS